jgi:protein-disulfide isomerase
LTPNGEQDAERLALAALREGPRAAWDSLVKAAREEGSSPRASPRAPSTAEHGRARATYEEDLRLGAVLDVRVTPTLFVNGVRLEGEPQGDVLESVIQREQRSMRWLLADGTPLGRAYAKRVERNLIAVDALAPDRACVPASGAPSHGPENALLTVVEFSGFECGPCGEIDAVLERAERQHPREIRRVFRALAPRESERAQRIGAFALAAQSALGDAAFWSLHRALRAAPPGLDDARLREIAATAGFPGEQLLALASQEPTQTRVRHDQELAQALGVPAVPTLFLNGRLLAQDLTPQTLPQLIAEELTTARRITRAGTPASEIDGLLCRAR